MNVAELTALLFGGAVAAGLIGALTGLGGGVVLVPMMTLLFGIDLQYAIGTALVSVIATSSGAAAAYVRDGYSSIRVGMFLEVATTLGALAGAGLAAVVPGSGIAVTFGVVLLVSALLSARTQRDAPGVALPDPLATRLRLNGSYPTPAGRTSYFPRRVPGAWLLMAVAGVLSGLLGIGSGALKVLAMDQVMGLPFKVSTTTSNFMIGVTAAASAGVYLRRGYIDPALVAPVMLGVLLGATAGSRILVHAQVRVLRLLFTAVIVALGIQMIAHGLGGKV